MYMYIREQTWIIITLLYKDMLGAITNNKQRSNRVWTEVDGVHSLPSMKWSVLYVLCTFVTLRESGVQTLLMASTHAPLLRLHSCLSVGSQYYSVLFSWFFLPRFSFAHAHLSCSVWSSHLREFVTTKVYLVVRFDTWRQNGRHDTV